jgi:hypothetical protein
MPAPAGSLPDSRRRDSSLGGWAAWSWLSVVIGNPFLPDIRRGPGQIGPCMVGWNASVTDTLANSAASHQVVRGRGW